MNEATAKVDPLAIDGAKAGVSEWIVTVVMPARPDNYWPDVEILRFPGKEAADRWVESHAEWLTMARTITIWPTGNTVTTKG
jgi:hypothetical protein